MSCYLQIDLVNAECDKLKQANTELQRQRDALEDEKDDVAKDKDRQIVENQRWWESSHPQFLLYGMSNNQRV